MKLVGLANVCLVNFLTSDAQSPMQWMRRTQTGLGCYQTVGCCSFKHRSVEQGGL